MNAQKILWTPVCAVADILPGTGVCARLGERHLAVFRITGEQIFAIDNIDPRSGASVLSRGLTGNLGAHLVVASPLYKNHFDLATGECLEDPAHSVPSYPVRINEGVISVLLSEVRPEALPPPSS
jgi:nitrite reductase (NADH) small subunit